MWLGFGAYGARVDVAAISGDGRRALTVREVGVAEIFDVAAGGQVGRIAPESPLSGRTGVSPGGEFRVFIESAALSGDGSRALLGLNDGTAGVFRVADGVRLALLHPPNEALAQRWQVIRAVAFAGPHALVGFDGRRVGVWSEDGARRVAWLESSAGARVVGQPSVRETLVSRVAGSADGRWIFAGSSDMTAVLWDLDEGAPVFEAIEQAEATIAVFDGPAGCGWATSAGSLWCARTGEPLRKLLATGEAWAEVVVRGDALLARDTQGGVAWWSFAGERRTLQPGPGLWSDRARTLAFGPGEGLLFPEGGRRLAWLRGDRRVAVEREAQIVSARLTPAGDAIVASGWLDQVELWSTEGALVRTFARPDEVGGFDLSSDGTTLAIGAIGKGGGNYPRTVLVYDAASGARLCELYGHDWQISRVACSPTGDRWSSSRSTTARVSPSWTRTSWPSASPAWSRSCGSRR